MCYCAAGCKPVDCSRDSEQTRDFSEPARGPVICCGSRLSLSSTVSHRYSEDRNQIKSNTYTCSTVYDDKVTAQSIDATFKPIDMQVYTTCHGQALIKYNRILNHLKFLVVLLFYIYFSILFFAIRRVVLKESYL